ncbi:MAG: hypothetical protein M0C28_30415 [Candidatus Moduliflexus flocculans]|nr:hypothetical protein [Candidatus Moduliflexus flocculans]
MTGHEVALPASNARTRSPPRDPAFYRSGTSGSGATGAISSWTGVCLDVAAGEILGPCRRIRQRPARAGGDPERPPAPGVRVPRPGRRRAGRDRLRTA